MRRNLQVVTGLGKMVAIAVAYQINLLFLGTMYRVLSLILWLLPKASPWT